MLIQKIIKEGIVATILLFTIIYFMGQGMFLMATVPIFIMLFSRFIPNQSFIFILIFIIKALGVRLPFYPTNMPVELPIIIVFLLTSILTIGISKTGSRKKHLTMTQIIYLFIFSLNIIFISIIRGINISRGNLSGGWYIVIFMVISTFILSRNIVIDKKKLRILMYAMLGGPLFRAAIQAFITYTGGDYNFLRAFVDVSTTSKLGDVEFGQRVYLKRLSTLNDIGYSLTFFSIRFLALNKVVAGYLILSIAFILTILSSYRNGILIIIVFLLLYITFFLKEKVKIIFIGLMFIIGGGIILYVIAPILPFQMQRSISFLPGINIPNIVKTSGLSTFNWRIELWQYTLSHFHEYMFIGRGLVRDYIDLHNYTTSESFLFIAYRFHSYHSSVLSLAMDFGLLGVGSFLIFSFSILYNFYKDIKKLEKNNFYVIFLRYYFCFYLAKFLVSILAGADAANVVYDAFISFALIQVLINSLMPQIASNIENKTYNQ